MCFLFFVPQMKSMTRSDTFNPGTVSMVYTVDKGGKMVPAADATTTLDVLSDQEVAIKLLYVVADKGNRKCDFTGMHVI